MGPGRGEHLWPWGLWAIRFWVHSVPACACAPVGVTLTAFQGQNSHYWGTICLFIFLIILGFMASALEHCLLFLASLSLCLFHPGTAGPLLRPPRGPVWPVVTQQVPGGASCNQAPHPGQGSLRPAQGEGSLVGVGGVPGTWAPLPPSEPLAEIWALMEMQAPPGGAASGVAAPGGPAGGQTALPATLAHLSPPPDGCSCCST